VRVIVSGYYGFGNVGDEAMLAGLMAGMKEAAGDAEFVILSGNPASTSAVHGVRAIARFDLRALRRELVDADLLISGGGSLFQDATSARSCLYYLYLIRQALKARVPVMVLGQGIGPLRRRWLRALTGFYLRRVQGIAVRDSESARALQRLGIGGPAVRVAADLSLAMALPAAGDVSRAYGDLGVRDGEPVLAIAPRTWRIQGVGAEFAAPLARAIGRAVSQIEPRPRVVVFPMQRPRDEEVCRDVAEAVGGISVEAQLSAPLLAGMMGRARTVVAVRLHALIFAAMGGSMPVAVSYDPKVQAFMADLGLPAAATTDRLDEERLATAIVEAWNADGAARERVRRILEERRDVVRDVFRWAAETARGR